MNVSDDYWEGTKKLEEVMESKGWEEASATGILGI